MSCPKLSVNALLALSVLFVGSVAVAQTPAPVADPQEHRSWSEPTLVPDWYDNALIQAGAGFGYLGASFDGGSGHDMSMGSFAFLTRFQAGIPITSEVSVVGTGVYVHAPEQSVDLGEVREAPREEGARMNWAGGQLGLLWIRPMESDLALTLDLSLGYGKLWVASPLNGSRRDEVEKQSVGMLGGSLGSTLELAVSESFRVGLRMGASQFRGTKSEETTAVAAEPTTRLATERHHAVVATLIEASFVIGWSL